MIAYEVLVQTIADWKAGARPTAPTPPPARVGTPAPVEELSSGVVDLDEDFGAEPADVDGGEPEGDYDVADDDEAGIPIDDDPT